MAIPDEAVHLSLYPGKSIMFIKKEHKILLKRPHFLRGIVALEIIVFHLALVREIVFPSGLRFISSFFRNAPFLLNAGSIHWYVYILAIPSTIFDKRK